MSEHFALSEFLHSDTARANGIDNFPTWEVVERLARLADAMEDVRTLLGDPAITISSGYRCPALNAEVGGVADSAHLYGDACDFVAPDAGTPTAIVAVLKPHLVALGVDQIIDESGGGARWVHLAIAAPGEEPRHQCFAV